MPKPRPCALCIVAGLEAFRSKLGTDLTAAKNQESETRMGMIRAADELDEVKRRHARQLQDMELESSRKDRELKAAVDALRDATDELARERESSRALKVRRSHTPASGTS